VYASGWMLHRHHTIEVKLHAFYISVLGGSESFIFGKRAYILDRRMSDLQN
jgi:hypothetical protein